MKIIGIIQTMKPGLLINAGDLVDMGVELPATLLLDFGPGEAFAARCQTEFDQWMFNIGKVEPGQYVANIIGTDRGLRIDVRDEPDLTDHDYYRRGRAAAVLAEKNASEGYDKGFEEGYAACILEGKSGDQVDASAPAFGTVAGDMTRSGRMLCGICGHNDGHSTMCPRHQSSLEARPAARRACECGGEKARTTHSDWCPAWRR